MLSTPFSSLLKDILASGIHTSARVRPLPHPWGAQEARAMTELGERTLDSGDSVVKKQGMQGG